MASTLLATLALVASTVAIAPLHVNDKAISGKYIVIFKKDSVKADRDAHMQSLDDSIKITHEYDFMNFYGYAAALSEASLALVREDDKVVDFVEAESVVSINKPVKQNIQLNGSAASCSVQDPAPWGLSRTSEFALTSDKKFSFDTTNLGMGVTSYIIDTGIYIEHSQFTERASYGFDAINENNPSDNNGHGTHVAGTVGGSTYGFARAANLVAVKVLGGSGSGSTAGVIDGIEFTCSDHTAKKNKCVGNMSLGGGFSAAMNRATEAATDCGCSMAVASGNSRADACSSSPASAAAPVMSVNAMTETDFASSFSNYGPCTDIYAPGSSILSAWIGSPDATNTISGTSMASPHVAGVMTLLAEYNDDPETIYKDILSEASSDKISGVPSTNTPNKLLHHPCAVRK